MIGHKKILDFFENAITAKKLSHAYCFVGAEHIGKLTMARHIAGKLLVKKPEALLACPDYILVERETDEKTGALKKDISIEQIIALRSRLAMSSFSGGYNAAIIANAEYMNQKSANALLKTLEEPREKTIIFLTTADETLLPETLLSRCQTIYLSPVNFEEIKSYILSTGVEANRANEIARDARGLPGLAIEWANAPEAYDGYRKEVELFKSLWGQSFSKKRTAVEHLFGDKTDHIAARDKWGDILSIWELAIRDNLIEATSQIPCSTLLDIWCRIKEARLWMNENIHPRLLIEHILLIIP